MMPACSRYIPLIYIRIYKIHNSHYIYIHIHIITTEHCNSSHTLSVGAHTNRRYNTHVAFRKANIYFRHISYQWRKVLQDSLPFSFLRDTASRFVSFGTRRNNNIVYLTFAFKFSLREPVINCRLILDFFFSLTK